MKRALYHIIIFCVFSTLALAQHTFQGTSLSEALMELDQSSKHYNISFVYDELEDFTVTKTIKRGRSLPDAVREVCGFYPVRVSVKGHDINVECIQKDRTKLMGRLIGPDRQPVVYANITLFSLNDSVYIGGGVSNEAGDFVIPCGMSQVKARISCVGFKTIERVMAIGDVGSIRMQIENNYLGNVTVSGRMPVIRSEADRLQYIVSNDEFARGLSAQELLNRVPMVSMAGGRAMILGRGPARFMLNGRFAEMGNEAIQQKLWTMRSEDIERIEVISNPSGREMMEMGGSYINIVMRRDQTLGWRGDVSTEVGISDDWIGRGSGSVSYASEKFDMTIDAHGGRTAQTTDEVSVYHYWYDAISDTRTKETNKELAANLTFRYLPAKHLELGGMLSWQALRQEKVTRGTFSYLNQSYWSEAESLFPSNTTKSMTVYCDWRIDSKGKLLSLIYSDYKKKEDMQTSAFYTSPPDQTRLNNYLYSYLGHYIDYHIQSGRLDFSLPLHSAVIGAGASYTGIKNPGYGNLKRCQEKTKAVYISFHHELKNRSFKAGLRYEHFGFDYYNRFKNTHDYWLPSISFTVKPKEGHQISLSWAASTQRPNFYDLNPLQIYKTSFEYSKGNPTLQPSQTSYLELNYHNYQGLYASAYYHRVTNVADWGKTISWGKIVGLMSYAEDTGLSNRVGLYLRCRRQLTPSLLTTAEGEFYYNDYDTRTNELILSLSGRSNPRLEESLWGCGLRLAFSADWYLNRQHTLLLNARYQHWFSEYQDATKTKGYGYFYLALCYSMLNDRLRLSLVANDPFHQFVTDETIFNVWTGSYPYVENPEPVEFCHTNHHSHYIGLTATYALGGNKVRRNHRDTMDKEWQRAEKKK